MKKRGLKKALCLGMCAVLGAALLTGCESKKEYPSQNITIVVPVKAGGDTDVYARILAQYMEKELGQSVAIKNVDGASGTIGSRDVYNAKNDGYTGVFFHASSILSEIAGVTDLDLLDYTIVSVPVIDKTATLVAPASKFSSFDDFVKKAESGEEIVASVAQGTYSQLACVLFEKEMGLKFKYVDSTSAADRIADMLAGRIDLFFSQYGAISQYVDSKDFISLGVMSEERNDFFPDVPTFKEQGADISMDKLFYLAFPPKTDPKIVETCSQALKKAVENPECIEAFAKYYVKPEFLGPEDSVKLLTETKELYQKFEGELKGE